MLEAFNSKLISTVLGIYHGRYQKQNRQNNMLINIASLNFPRLHYLFGKWTISNFMKLAQQSPDLVNRCTQGGWVTTKTDNLPSPDCDHCGAELICVKILSRHTNRCDPRGNPVHISFIPQFERLRQFCSVTIVALNWLAWRYLADTHSPGWQDLAGFRRGQKWPWNLSSSAYLQFSRQMRRFCA